MAEKPDVFDAIEALATHCRPPIMDPAIRAQWLLDWYADLAEFPLDAIKAGCAEWRKSGNVKFPTSGALIPLVRRFVGADPGQAKAKPWTPTDPDAFRNLSVRDKIRELSILAHQARTKAGPMFRNTTPPGSTRMSGKHLTAEEMPDTWRRWTAEAERLEAEIGRLRRAISTPFQHAAE